MSFHFFHINELYSNASGTVQFIEFVGDDNNQHQWAGHEILSGSQTLDITTNLPSSLTSGKSVLVATQGFANLGLVTPDYIMPSGFLSTTDGSVIFPDMDDQFYLVLPTNGIDSLSGSNGIETNSPTNFAGVTASIPGNPIVGTSSANALSGTAAKDFMVGLGGNDTLNGGNGNDTLNGGNGNDTLNGGGGKDTLNGGSGNDVLRGLASADVLTGGAGTDRFDFDAVADSGIGSTQRDKILDFTKGEDKIDLSTIDANSGVAGDQVFKFIGTKAFSANASGQLRFDAANNLLLGSTDADSTAEFSILLTGVNSMTGANFIL